MSTYGVKTSLGDMDDVVRVFNKFDANGDGKISKSELTAMLEKLGSHEQPEEVDRMMAEMDCNGDGSVDLAEFTAFHGGGGPADMEVRDAFDQFDSDGDGKISARELHAVLTGLGENCTVKECEKMIRGVDVDGDGCVDLDEFKMMMKL